MVRVNKVPFILGGRGLYNIYATKNEEIKNFDVHTKKLAVSIANELKKKGWK